MLTTFEVRQLKAAPDLTMNNADSSVLTPYCVNVRPEDTILLANFIPLCTTAQQTHVHIFSSRKNTYG
jgi:hypothetical protein